MKGVSRVLDVCRGIWGRVGGLALVIGILLIAVGWQPWDRGVTGLVMAADKGGAARVVALLGAGAKPDDADNVGWTAWMVAAIGGHDTVARGACTV